LSAQNLPDSDPSGGWHAVLQGFDEIVIDLLFLLATGQVFEAMLL